MRNSTSFPIMWMDGVAHDLSRLSETDLRKLDERLEQVILSLTNRQRVVGSEGVEAGQIMNLLTLRIQQRALIDTALRQRSRQQSAEHRCAVGFMEAARLLLHEDTFSMLLSEARERMSDGQ